MKLFMNFCLALAAAIIFLVSGSARAQDVQPSIKIETPEVYELANVILALTAYGQADPLEVQKGTPYYELVMNRFGPFASHPLISEVNYSREAWENYLGFRTDSYAFVFDEAGRLHRTSDFRATSVSPFDDHLAQIEDFARVSGFREFYQEQAPFFADLRRRYEESYWIPQSRAFLEREFGQEYSSEYRAVLSPLVGRMNAQRSIGAAQLGFVNVAPALLKMEGTLGQAARLMEFHTLLTEMDHGYVNPVSQQHLDLINSHFDFKIWNTSDGYASAEATFNEYMTWAVYDLIAREIAGPAAEQSIANWHYINKRRGFVASELFGEKLAQLYRDRPAGTRIRDLYPAMLTWTAERQGSITHPVIESPKVIMAATGDSPTQVLVRFSEPMRPMTSVTVSRFRWDGSRFRWTDDIELTGLEWSADGRTLTFPYVVPSEDRPALAFNLEDNTPVTSQAGVYLSVGERIEFSRPQATT